MIRIKLLVEGQTEEAFVNELLVAPYANRGIYLTPIIVLTSPGHRGGLVNYAKVRGQLEKLCREDSDAYITTLFDLYALPTDFPGKSSPDYPATGNGQQKAEFLERALEEHIGKQNFFANILVHEFEALLFTDINAFAEWTDDDRDLQPLHAARATLLPEDINELPHTAPSKRILAAMPNYQKPVHGPLIALSIGLDAIRAACPHFNRWLERIESLPART